MSGKDGGYILPLEINPPRFCVTIEIPNDIYHIAAFWGALDQLTWSKNWQRDPDHKAALVARVWSGIIDEAAARMNAGEECMPPDPCCPEEIEKLTELVTLNTTIVANLTTIVTNQETTITNQLILIDNSETVIEQNDTQIIQNYFSTYNQWVYENHQTSILNQQLYDGTPQSIHPDVPVGNFGSGSAENDALCLACTRYLEDLLAQMHNSTTVAALGLGFAAAVALIGLGIVLAPVTAGASIVAGFGAAGTLIAGFTVSQLENILNDSAAQREVVCCMFDTLKDKEITFEDFKTMTDGCELEGNAETLRGWISERTQLEPNYLAFLRVLGEAQGQGNENDCDCCSDIADYEIVALNGCVVTRINDFQWRIEQTVGVSGPGDPFCGAYTYYTAEFKEAEGRCIDIIGASGTAMSGYNQIDCAGNPVSGVGGGGGQGTYFSWFSKACPPDPTTLDITITIACPTDLGFVP